MCIRDRDGTDVGKVSRTIVAPRDATNKDNSDVGKVTTMAPRDATSEDNSADRRVSVTTVAPGVAAGKDNSHDGKKGGTRVSPTRAVKKKRDNGPVKGGGSSGKGENAQRNRSIVLKVPVVEKRGEHHAASPHGDAVSDDDLPLSAVAAKIRDK